MSSKKILTAEEIRAELARRKISKRELSRATGINYDYVIQILNDQRLAKGKREIMTKYLKENAA